MSNNSTTPVTVRIEEETKDKLRKQAERFDMELSEFLRPFIQEAAEEPLAAPVKLE